jgi:hypothetical protein
VATFNHDGLGAIISTISSPLSAQSTMSRRPPGPASCMRLNAGDLLIEAKRRLKHGEPLARLSERCNILERWARDYMRLARYLRALFEGTRT